jgi:RNA polymerase sigma-70 factor (ECF subfamily)
MIACETRALEELCGRYAAQALGMATRLLGDRGRAEDAVQDVFYSLWRAAPSYNTERGSVRSWLFRAVRNRCIDYQRQNLSRPRLVSDDEAIERLPAPNIDELAISSVDGEIVRRAFRHIPREQAQAIELAYYDGYTQREIAEMLGLPIGTVKSRTRLGLHALRRRLTA